MEKSGKILETVMLACEMQMFVTLVITPAFATFLALYDTQDLKFKV